MSRHCPTLTFASPHLVEEGRRNNLVGYLYKACNSAGNLTKRPASRQGYNTRNCLSPTVEKHSRCRRATKISTHSGVGHISNLPYQQTERKAESFWTSNSSSAPWINSVRVRLIRPVRCIWRICLCTSSMGVVHAYVHTKRCQDAETIKLHKE